ncbi:MAG: Txe/YoeB family addiction module toxin [Dysgonamonadaceae bacterium]|jgi:toxin YoeB|nr:Txe/YoeB family addiction module toxin [Dysgonamonadaceae bacterium]
MKTVYTNNFKKHFVYWRQNNKKTAEKISELIKAVENDPFGGIGKPEPLAYTLSGCWSRRINREHRLVYRVQNGELQLLSCRFHY